MNEKKMQELLDKEEIRELLQNWGFWRDQGNWEKLKTTFHPEGTMSVTWFSGRFDTFIRGSMEMRKTRSRSKHAILGSMIRLGGEPVTRAVSETNVLIAGRSVLDGVELDSTAWARFYDQLEKRDGVWRILKRVAIYEKDRFDPLVPGTPLPFTSKDLEALPEPYSRLGYALTKGGFPVSSDLPVNGSPQLEKLYAEGDAWLVSGTKPHLPG